MLTIFTISHRLHISEYVPQVINVSETNEGRLTKSKSKVYKCGICQLL